MLTFLIRAFVYLACFAAAWYGLSAVNYEKFLRQGHVTEAQILYFMLAAGIAYLAGSFVLSFAYLI